MINKLMIEAVAIAATIDPDAYGAGTETSDYVNMADFEQVMAIIQTGTLGTSATVDAKIVQATDSSGTGKKDITGKAITQLVKASNDDDQAAINTRREDLDTVNGFTHIALELTVGTATSDCGAILLGGGARHEPVAGADLASVVELVN